MNPIAQNSIWNLSRAQQELPNQVQIARMGLNKFRQLVEPQWRRPRGIDRWIQRLKGFVLQYHVGITDGREV